MLVANEKSQTCAQRLLISNVHGCLATSLSMTGSMMHDERLPVVDPEGVVDSSIHLVDSVVDADELLSELVIHLCKCRIQRAEPFVNGVEPFVVLVELFVILVEAFVEVFAQTV